MGPVSSSRQTTPVQIYERGGPRYNYGDHRNKQNIFTTNQPELPSHRWEAHSVQAYTRELGWRQENVVHDQIQYQRMLNREQMIKEEDIQQQQVQSTAPQRKTTKTQATQVHERERCENQSGQSTSRKLVHQGSIEEECLRKEPFFVNHYYSHPLGQCCCQQRNVSMKEDRIIVHASTGSNQEKSENSRNSQQESEARTCNNIVYLPAQNGMNEHGKKVIQDRNNEYTVDPRVQFTQASVPNRRDTVPLYAVITSIPPPLMMKKEKEEYQTNVKVETETPQKDEDLLKVVQMVAESL